MADVVARLAQDLADVGRQESVRLREDLVGEASCGRITSEEAPPGKLIIAEGLSTWVAAKRFSHKFTRMLKL